MDQINIDDLSHAELVALNHQIVQRLKMLDHIRAHEAMLKFHIGERVSFEPSGRGVMTGTLAKYNKKTVTVVTDDGGSWNVSPGLLSKPEGRRLQSPGDGKIIDINDGRTA